MSYRDVHLMDPTGLPYTDSRGLLLAAGLLTLSLLFLVGYRRQQWRIRSGKELARATGRNEDGLLTIDMSFLVTRADAWHRIAASFDLVAESKEGFLERLESTRHRYALSLRDPTGQIVVSEAGAFQDFLMLTLSRSKGTSKLTGADSSLRCHGDDVPMLEFVPPGTGGYRITLEMPVEEAIKDGSFVYTSRLENFALSIREYVLPLQSRAYPHKKLDLRKTAVGVREARCGGTFRE